MLADMNSDDPVVRSRAVQSHTTLSPLIQQLVKTKKTTGVHYAARKFKSLQEACTILQVTHDPEEHIWNRQDIDDVPSATLSSGVNGVIQRLKHSD
ncbi:hypothetical protein N7519_002844 [Penicillium mononematosum]|uniref:uncharacterized protein n=1 Tax=Penicillium mononematosum TaxID=268346 RepID=UPI002548135B|nr:uncharacterized protein N7519_002844 [Penicillium mononematosum]KAJ6187936.1 hypothetical protein N7519_002844 [Penicillium mononematosum]